MIFNTKAENQKNDLSLIDNEDLILFIKEWAQKNGKKSFFNNNCQLAM